MNDNNKLLTICIPTYNRKEILYKCIQNILTCKSQDFEILVVDNKSTDGTVELLHTISDARLRIYENEVNIGGILNPLRAPLYAIGKYTILLLDKDGIYSEYLSNFLDFLKENELTHGYCKLNDEKLGTGPCSIFSNNFECLLNTSYLSKHPSGMFWNTRLYKDCPLIGEISSNVKVFGFYFEFVNAFFSVNYKGNCCIYNEKLIFTESEEDCGKILTKSYNKENLFFLPKNRCFEYKMYLNDFCKYVFLFEKTEIYEINKKLIKEFCGALWSLRKLKNNQFILNHYGISSKDIRIIDCLFYSNLFICWYLFKYKGAFFKTKIKVIVYIIKLIFREKQRG